MHEEYRSPVTLICINWQIYSNSMNYIWIKIKLVKTQMRWGSTQAS